MSRSKLKILPYHPDDLLVVLEDGLRKQDQDEIEALGRTAEQALVSSINFAAPFVFTVHYDHRAAAIFGAGAFENTVDIGVPWMLGTNLMLRAARELIVEAPRWIEFMNAVYPVLSNFVDERNDTAIRWLTKMGFEFPYTDDFVTPEGVTFRRFVKCATPS